MIAGIPQKDRDAVEEERLILLALERSKEAGVRITKAAIKTKLGQQAKRALTVQRQSVAIKTNSNGWPVSCLTNCVAWLEGHKDRFAFNLMSLRKELDGHQMQDSDTLKIYEFLENSAKVAIKKEHVKDAISRLCFARQYHPIQDELRASVWDGVNCVDSMMEAYFKTVPENLNDDERERLIAYSTAVSRAVLIGAVQRIMNPGGIFR